MISKENLEELLSLLNFSQSGRLFIKNIGNSQYKMIVDISKEELIYPDGVTINDHTTCNFDHPENFVVFECVHRLLEKGYRPEHIELERRWQLGHEQKSGKADIVVSDAKGSTILIIECKTAGNEYKNALKILKQDGGQLFSYWQQDQSALWLELYSSDIDEKTGTLTYKDAIISCIDDKNTEATARTNVNTKLYSQSHTAEELFKTWKETYNQQIYEGLIFGEDTVAYKIGIKPLRKRDLRDLAADDSIVNRFEEILRHNNVSDKENAFNRLVALFICKLVDEITKGDDDEVEFQYKPVTDNYEDLQDRLQRLHRDGMKQFMRENISYVEYDYAEKLFEQYNGVQRQNAIADLKKTIRILKFYSNNDFAFKDVHNEELFLQNGKVLVEVVQLFEHYRIVYPSRNQLLGDLFEQLLNKGFKQNEGQFFTPTPITRFIWDSLPLADFASNNCNNYPRVIDFACGAGHFLTEAVEAINFFFKTGDLENRWVEHSIYGIEKDYRLARVARVSLYMNGAGSGNIIFGDGLDNYPEKEVCPASFDILVANPPYSVKGFKSHLSLQNNEFETLKYVTFKSGQIEVPFIERIAQLLKPRGIAAVILPSSILSNTSKSYTAARSVLMRNFLLHGIAQFGSKTFGATGTNTVILFVEKYDEPPKRANMVDDAINNILSGKVADDWEDKSILDAYCKVINVQVNDYMAFADENKNVREWGNNAYFKQYVKNFYGLTKIKNLRESKRFKACLIEDQDKQLKTKFYTYVKAIERSKLEFFALTMGQKTVIATSPSTTKEQKNYLGYFWSNAKGSEGIHITDPYTGVLYDSRNRNSLLTVAAIIRRSFTNPIISIPTVLEKYCKVVSTTSLLNFTRAKFNNSILPNNAFKIEIKSRWPLIKLGDISEVKKGTSITLEQIVPGNIKVVAGGMDYAYMHNTSNRDANTITVSSSGENAGYINFWDEPIFASDCITIKAKNDTTTRFIYYCLGYYKQNIFAFKRGAGQPHVYAEDLAFLEIPHPGIKDQENIVSQCIAVDAAYAKAKQLIETKQQEIEDLYSSTNLSNVYPLSDSNYFVLSIGRRVLDSELKPNGKYPVYSANVIAPFGMIDDLLIKDFSTESVIWGIDGDWQVNTIPANSPFFPTDHCGVVRVKNNAVEPKYLAWSLYKEGLRQGFSRSFRASTDRVLAISVQLPSLAKQKEIVAEVNILEQEIAKAKDVMNVCVKKKLKILQENL